MAELLQKGQSPGEIYDFRYFLHILTFENLLKDHFHFDLMIDSGKGLKRQETDDRSAPMIEGECLVSFSI